MTAPGIDPLNNIPNPQDFPAEFDADSFAFTQTELPRVISQINALVTWMNVNVNGSPPANESTAAFDITNDKSGKYLRATYAGAKVATVLADLTVVSGSQWILFNTTSGDLTFIPGGGVTINNNVAVSQNSAAILKKVSSNVFDLMVLGGSSGGGMTNPMTTVGDLIVGGTSGTPARLPIGPNGTTLGIVDGEYAWIYPSFGQTFEASPNSSFAYDGFPMTAPGVGNANIVGSIESSPFDTGGGGSFVQDVPGWEFAGVGFVWDSATNDLFFVLVLPGSTGNENFRLTGVPDNPVLLSENAEYGFNSVDELSMFAWELAPGLAPDAWLLADESDPIILELTMFNWAPQVPE